MIKCNNCGNINPDEYTFCAHCGYPLRDTNDQSVDQGNARHEGGQYRPTGSFGKNYNYGKNYSYQNGADSSSPPPPPPPPPPPHGYGTDDSYSRDGSEGYGGTFREADKPDEKKGIPVFIWVVLIVLVTAAIGIAIFAVVHTVINRTGKGRDGAESTIESAEASTQPAESTTEKPAEEDIKEEEPSTYNEPGSFPQSEDNESGKGAEDDVSDEAAEEEDEDPYADFVFPDSDSRYLSDSEVSGLSKDRLRLAINEIYARRGWDFETQEIKDHFLQYDWYRPVSRNEEDMHFNKYEKANIDLLDEYRDMK